MKQTALLILLCINVGLAQSWHQPATLSVGNNISAIDLFSNSSGNHIVISNQTNNYIKYFLVNTLGDTLRSALIDSYGEFPAITGDSHNIYIGFKWGNNKIKFYKSTNNGIAWTTIPEITTSSNYFSGLRAVYENSKGLMVVWSTQDTKDDFETYFYRYHLGWTNYKQVTDYENEVGGRPAIAYSDNKIHISYNTGNDIDYPNNRGAVKTRDFVIQNQSWETPQNAYWLSTSVYERLIVANSKLHLFYLDSEFKDEETGDIIASWAHMQRDLNSTWGSSSSYLMPFSTSAFDVTVTADNFLKVLMQNGYDYSIYQGIFQNNTWTVTTTSINTAVVSWDHFSISSVSNDIYSIVKNTSNNTVKYFYYDDKPLAPQNLQYSITAASNPQFTWLNYKEADLNGYIIERGNGSIFDVIGQTSTNSFIDYDVSVGPVFEDTYDYRVKAKDLNNLVSLPSNIVTVENCVEHKQSASTGNGDNLSYKLYNAYPNPFNPRTTIEFEIPQKDYVSIILYNVLGKELKTLINGIKEKGTHQVQVNGTDLVSGIYFVKIQTNNFIKTQKLILIK